MTHDDEFTPRELGLLVGAQVAAAAAAGELPEDWTEEDMHQWVLDSGMRERLEEFGSERAEREFWAGVDHGIRAEFVRRMFQSPN